MRSAKNTSSNCILWVNATVILKDYDATFMRMKVDHMYNGQLKLAYNVQLAFHSEYIIMGIGVFPKLNDTNTLIPFVQ